MNLQVSIAFALVLRLCLHLHCTCVCSGVAMLLALQWCCTWVALVSVCFVPSEFRKETLKNPHLLWHLLAVVCRCGFLLRLHLHLHLRIVSAVALVFALAFAWGVCVFACLCMLLPLRLHLCYACVYTWLALAFASV